MNFLLFKISWLLFFADAGPKKWDWANVADLNESSVLTNLGQPGRQVSNKPVPTKSASVQARTWVYEKTLDKAGRPVYKASLFSPTLLQFNFPYAGGSTATLTIRKRDSGTTLYLYVSRGQFNRSFQGGSARIRFDEKPPGTYLFSAAENGSANIIFFDSAEKLIDRMKKSKKMTVEIEFYAQGKRQIDFQTANLTWSH